MKILEYSGFDRSSMTAAYRKVTDAILRDDFRAAQVKKLTGSGPLNLWRAKLNDSDRLLFTIVRHGNETCALLLEVIRNHAYDTSRFLRGAVIDESKIPDTDAGEALAEARPLRYLHPERTVLHLLDKPVSFDDAQETIYRQAPPLVIVGSAGSGKTALTLEKLKHAEGEVLYVTLSAFLAESARSIYYSNGFDHSGQETSFLSWRDFIESIRVPSGHEATWRHFSGWFSRVRNAFRELEPHQAFEEIRGVITAGTDGVLSLDGYKKLGVRQSIYIGEQRRTLYTLFEKYRQWLATEKLYDINMIAHEYMEMAEPRYDFIVIDEVQDLTPVQLALVLKSLRKPGNFILCGDSNQIVHPNFFSWSQVRTLFWNDPKLAERQKLCILTANFRNGTETTRLANRLLKIKQLRFGSIDRESNYLVDPVGEERGTVTLMADNDDVRKELNAKTKQSTKYAVLVMRDEDKAAARKHFSTPLLFSIHEAKGLEYSNIVLYGFVSGNRKEFAEIVEGVAIEQVESGEFEYSRAKDKNDKSLEVYKFFVNALYVAMTRAISNLYIIESDTRHRLFDLLSLSATGKIAMAEERSSAEEWHKEARKLELQGKQEQADAIRSTILRQTPPPWRVFDETMLRDLLGKVFNEKQPGNKPKQQLFEYATCHDEPVLAERLKFDADYENAAGFQSQLDGLGRKSYIPYFSQNIKGILKQCMQHGIDHRLPMNQTPLMAAAAAGNITLVEKLLEAGANQAGTDHYGFTALHWAMRRSFRDPGFAQGSLGALYDLLAPSSVDLMSAGRLVRLDRHLPEYFLFQTFWVLFKSRFILDFRKLYPAFDTRTLLEAWKHMPPNVLRPERNHRQYLSGLLARNERERAYAWNRSLFVRITKGWYQLNPLLSVRKPCSDEQQEWQPLFQALNLPLVCEFSNNNLLAKMADYFRQGGHNITWQENAPSTKPKPAPTQQFSAGKGIQAFEPDEDFLAKNIDLLERLMKRSEKRRTKLFPPDDQEMPQKKSTEKMEEKLLLPKKKRPSPDQLGFDF